MDKRQIIKTLSSFHGVSGYEFKFTDKIKEVFLKYCDDVNTDSLGNIIALKKSEVQNAGSVMIEAHCDEIGLMITDIDERGFLYFAPVGGIDARILPGKQVVIHGTKDILGVVGAKPPHITTAKERSQAIPMKEMYIDTGYSFEDVKNIVSVGDTVTFDDGFRELGTKFISTKSQDDRTGVAVLLFVMDKLKNVKLPFDVYYCACVQEEVSRGGAATAATRLNPDFAIAIDVCHCVTPDAPAGEDTFKAGSGTVVSKGPNIHPLLVQKVIDVLDDNNIPYNIAIDGGDSGTDAWAIQVARCGIPSVLFSLPLRYMHTMVETLSIDDVNATVNAIAAFLQSIEDTEAILCYQ